MIIKGGCLWLGSGFVNGFSVIIENEKIQAIVGEDEVTAAPDVNAHCCYVVPGFIDLLNHGSGGFSPEDSVADLARFLPQTGVTSFLPSILTNPMPVIREAITRIADLPEENEGAASILGIHLEGPFFNPKYGGQMASSTACPSREIIAELLSLAAGRLRMVTLAPEVPGVLETIPVLREAGVTVSIGHSEADLKTYRQARAAGVDHVTHLLNAMGNSDDDLSTYRGVKPTGLEEHILVDDGVTVDLIADRNGCHVSPTWLKIALKCKGIERISLVTDAMPAAGLPPGRYSAPDGQSITTRPDEDVARLDSGLLYGFTGTMIGALGNFMRHTGLSLAQALPAVTINPARVIGEQHRRGRLAPGFRADLVLLSEDLEVQTTIIGGRIAYQRPEP